MAVQGCIDITSRESQVMSLFYRRLRVLVLSMNWLVGETFGLWCLKVV